MKIEKFVEGIPKAQPRPKSSSFKRTDKKTGIQYDSSMIYNPKSADGWKDLVKLAFIGHRGRNIEDPIICDIIFLMPRPKSLMRKKDPDGRIRHTKKPDRDNLDKSVMDCLSAPVKKKKGNSFVLVGGIGVWKDDCQVYKGTIEKYYCAKNENPGAYITITWGE